jgi:Spy/CpxP family protein refolding chaperone
MKVETKVRSRWISAAALLLLAGAVAQANAQTAAPGQSQAIPAQNQVNQQANQIVNVQEALNLTPEQIQKWRAINADLKDQQQAANQRLRLARRALADAIESPTSNEELIKQRAKDVSEAQAATTQLQALKESRILQTLSPEQRVKLREIREHNQALIRERNEALRREGNQQGARPGLGRRQDGVPRNGNTAAPLGPKQRKLMRQQPKR